MCQRVSCPQDKSVKYMFSWVYTFPASRFPNNIGLLCLHLIGTEVWAFLSIKVTIFLLLWPNLKQLCGTLYQNTTVSLPNVALEIRQMKTEFWTQDTKFHNT